MIFTLLLARLEKERWASIVFGALYILLFIASDLYSFISVYMQVKNWNVLLGGGILYAVESLAVLVLSMVIFVWLAVSLNRPKESAPGGSLVYERRIIVFSEVFLALCAAYYIINFSHAGFVTNQYFFFVYTLFGGIYFFAFVILTLLLGRLGRERPVIVFGALFILFHIADNLYKFIGNFNSGIMYSLVSLAAWVLGAVIFVRLVISFSRPKKPGGFFGEIPQSFLKYLKSLVKAEEE